MILTGYEIIKQRQLGAITLEPFDEGNINPNSYNYSLGSELVEFLPGEINPFRYQYRRYKIPEEGVVLRPSVLYLGVTSEIIGSSKYVTSLIGRSTIGRLGLWLQVTADLGHIGNHHCWTLELKVVQPLRVFAGMKIGQVTFWRYDGKAGGLYNDKYAKDTQPTLSRIIQNEEFLETAHYDSDWQ